MASSSNNRAPTANRGGASSIATPANSGGGGIFGGSTVGAAHGAKDDASKAAGTAASATASATEYRRKSQESSGLFGNISSLKRTSQDQTAQARKASLSEQRPAPGVFGQMWNNFTKGTGDSGQK